MSLLRSTRKNCCFSEQGILDFAFCDIRQFWREARVLFGMLLRGERWQTRAHVQLRVHSTCFQVPSAVIKALWSCFSFHLAAAPMEVRGRVACCEKAWFACSLCPQGPVIYAQLDHSGGQHSDKINKSESVVYADIRKNWDPQLSKGQLTFRLELLEQDLTQRTHMWPLMPRLGPMHVHTEGEIYMYCV